jgi:sialate O-acetylesterase
MTKSSLQATTILIIFLMFFSCKPAEKRELSLNSFFSDHMVLQQKENVKIWGNYTPQKQVSISASWGKTAVATSDKYGKWKLDLETPSAGGPYDLTISTAESAINIKDVLIGEVWLASGQSNMEMPLTGYLPNEPVDNYKQEIENAKYSEIRMFTVENILSNSKLDNVSGNWQVCSPETADKFSATGYFFARKLHQELGVPIGIINSSWGGTEVEAWTSKEALFDFPEFLDEIASNNETLVSNWVKQFKTKTVPFTLEEIEKYDLNDAEFIDPEYDDSNWIKVNLPHEACLSDDFIPDADSSFYLNGFFWYRKTFTIDNPDSDYQLNIGAIDDADVSYINGHKVGYTLSWNTPRIYTVPTSLLKKGENTIVIKHFDGGGGSQVSGPIFLENQNGDKINLEGMWSGLFYADIIGQDIILYGLEHQEKLKDRPQTTQVGPNELASSLFNGMINPLIPYNIKGAIWYQGESNVGRFSQYEKLFPIMINDWRSRWKSEFPFYFVQIAPFKYAGKAENKSQALRDAQRKSLKLPKTGMAVTMDIGHPTKIHPGNKQDVGDRLARLALANDYEKDIIASGPLYKSKTFLENKIILSFEYTGSGLKASEDELLGFEIAGIDKKYVPANAIIINNQIELSAPSIMKPVNARYGWRDFIKGTLFNEEGLPASSFTTE